MLARTHQRLASTSPDLGVGTPLRESVGVFLLLEGEGGVRARARGRGGRLTWLRLIFGLKPLIVVPDNYDCGGITAQQTVK